MSELKDALARDPFDVIVIGAGIVGCASAFYLARRGLRVAVVERAGVGAGTTSNSFAWINATSKVADEPYHRLNALGQATYRELAVEFGERRIGLHATGMLQWVRRSDAAAHATLAAQAAKLCDYDYPVTWVGRGALTALEPHIDFPSDAEALYAMADPCLDAPLFCRFIAEQLQRLGASVFEHCEAVELRLTDQGAVTGVATTRGRLSAKRVLVCAGPGTPELLSELTGFAGYRSRFPMTRVPGLLVTTPDTAPKQLVRHVVYAASGDRVHVLPAANGGLKIGADDTDGMVSDDPTPEVVRRAAMELLGRTQRMIPDFAGASCIDECRVGIGVRPFPRDGMSLVGALPGAEGVYVIATHSGVTLAPAVGKLVCELIVEGRTPDMLKPFLLDRFRGFGG